MCSTRMSTDHGSGHLKGVVEADTTSQADTQTPKTSSGRHPMGRHPSVQVDAGIHNHSFEVHVGIQPLPHPGTCWDTPLPHEQNDTRL